MAKKLKIKYTGKVLYQSDPDFDWSVYDNGYEGGCHLTENKLVKTANKKDKVFCHESYAQELYDLYEKYFNGCSIDAKDALRGVTYNVTGINVVSDHEISVDTASGMSAVIDMNKEHQYLSHIGCENVPTFLKAVKESSDFRKAIEKSGLVAKVMANGRISLWEGIRGRLESEFMEAIRNSDDPKYAYNAKILEVNNGGYIVDVSGIRCFLPGSLASNGVVSNFEELVGKTLEVIPVNFVQNMFVVSHKKYLERIMPAAIESELYVGKEVFTKVTGTSKNGVFLTFKNNAGDWFFSGLCHRSCMSKDYEKDFDKRRVVVGDQMRMYIHAINVTDNGYRIVLGDAAPVVESTNSDESAE